MMSIHRAWLVAMAVGAVGLAASAQPPKPAGQNDDRKPRSAENNADLKPPLRKPVIGAHAGAGPALKGKNLVPNGDFEAGDVTPSGWQTIDGLCSFWVRDDDPKHGKVLKFDTDVLQSQAYAWWPKLVRGSSPRVAPKKLPTVEPKYDTIAGNDGVWFWSDYIPVEKGKAYWLTVDVKGPGILVWLVGYPERAGTEFGSESGVVRDLLKEQETGKPVEKGRGHESLIHKYVWKGQMAAGGSDGWKTYSRRKQPFRPTVSGGTPNGVKFVRVLVYPFWPPATYYVDNVRLVEVDEGKGANGE